MLHLDVHEAFLLLGVLKASQRCIPRQATKLWDPQEADSVSVVGISKWGLLPFMV